ncbi:MAG TPA: DUF2780 domain-containing protein [Syntrophales bacterium]|nr:DUF2780 domain-containing protein [Syntrophales bacterium]
MKRSLLVMTAALTISIVFGMNASVLAQGSGLVQLLTKDLGVTEKQASGGAGSIFNLAKQNLSAGDFAQVSKAVPGINSMMAAAPKSEGATGMLGGASSLLGGGASSVDKAAGLAGSFSQLGMNAGMVNQFMPIIMNYVKAKGGQHTMQLLEGALK